ncbi:MAG: hypothetical protein ACYDA2_09320 [Acidimicrobiales bacterium]
MGDHELHGVRFRTPLELGAPVDGTVQPELTLSVEDPRPIGFDLPVGEVVLDLVVGDRRIHSGAVEGHRAVLRIPELCEFVVDRDTGEGRCTPDPRASDEQLVLLVRGSLVAFLLGLSGACVLHASVVEIADDGTAVAFVAGSGMGKSTMAALLCGAGGRLVSDDLLRLDDATPPRWVGRSAELRLRPAATGLVPEDGSAWATRPTIDGRVASSPPRTASDHGALAAVVVPVPSRTDHEVSARRIPAVEATMLLACFPRLERWLSPAVLEANFDGVSRLASAVPVHRVSVPWGPPFSPTVATDVLDRVGVTMVVP